MGQATGHDGVAEHIAENQGFRRSFLDAAALEIPQTQRFVLAPRDRPSPVGAHAHAPDGEFVPLQHPQALRVKRGRGWARRTEKEAGAARRRERAGAERAWCRVWLFL